MKFTFDDISEIPDESLLPRLDRAGCSLATADEERWSKDGYLILRNFIPKELIEGYKKRWRSENASSDNAEDDRLGGWPDCTPYLRYPEVLNLATYPPLAAKLKELIGDDMGTHLNLTGWVSTQRNWHQDDYLNPDFLNCWYAAVWIALDTIHPDSGPFQYVPGSHKWPLTRRHLLFNHIPTSMHNDPAWPNLTQDAVSKAFEGEIATRAAPIRAFTAEAGDVLIWHGRLAHRGSQPSNSNRLRPAFIAHYSAISKRKDMPSRKQTEDGVYYFDFDNKENGKV